LGVVFVILNPWAGRGRGARLAPAVRAAFQAHGGAEVLETRAAGDEARLVGEALARGATTIVAVGGDGTWSNVAQAVLASGASVRMAFVPAGTGSDLAKTIGLPPNDVEACARIAAEGHTRRLDVGRVEERHFLNIVGFGLDIAVLEHSWRVNWLRGNLVYLYCALRQMFAYSGFPLEIRADDAAARSHELLMLIVANARIFGGGFQIAPHADPFDGRLEVVGFRNVGALRRLALMRLLLTGRHMREPEVVRESVRRLVLRFAAPPAYETDGEWNQARSSEITIEVLPGALEVLVPERG
jgi:diacylglycerol kinase (ATP)